MYVHTLFDSVAFVKLCDSNFKVHLHSCFKSNMSELQTPFSLIIFNTQVVNF